MTPAFLHTMLLLSLPMFAGLGWAGLLLSNAQRRQARFAAQVASLTTPNRLPAAAGHLPVARAPARQRSSRLNRVLRLFGCDYERRAIYPVAWWVVVLAAFVLGRIVMTISSSILGSLSYLLWPAICILASRTAFGYWDSKRRDIMLKQFPDALAMVVRSVRVGVPVNEAIRVVAREAPEPTGPEFARLADAIAIGTPLDVALRESAGRTKLPEYRFFATALTLQAQAGGTLSDSLEMLADIIRKRVGLKARGYALTSEGRTSTMVLCIMPFAMGGMLFLLNRSYMMVMFANPLGRKLLVVGLVMLGTAIVIMRKMIKSTLT